MSAASQNAGTASASSSASRREVRLPDLGDFHDMPVVEISVQPGDVVAAEQTLLMIESDKATMDVPTPFAGRVVELKVALGDKVNEGTLLAIVDAEGGAGATTAVSPASAQTPEALQSSVGAPVAAAAPSARNGTEPEAHVFAAPVILPTPEAPDPNEPALPAGDHADLVVIGAGPGGYTAAFRAADLGRQVTLIDRWDKLGGVCLNVGCIPSKALLHAAKVVKDAEDFGTHGVRFAKPEVDLPALNGWKDSVVGRLTGGLVDLARRRNVTVLHGTARFTGPHSVAIDSPAGTRSLRFDQAILAAGSEPVRLPFLPADDPRVVDSTGALALTEIPKRFLVIGGGIIGLEMATVYEALGSEVTVVEFLDQIIPGADRDLVAPLHKRMGARCTILLKTKVTSLEAHSDGLLATLEGPDGARRATFDKALVAVGRRANGRQLDAAAAGLTLNPDGTVPVDRQLRTNVPHIFAIGDLAGPPMLAHKATHEAKVAAEAACGQKVAFEARVIPSVAYTDPEVAWAGLTEAEARRDGLALEKSVFPWAASGRSLALGRDEGFTKLLFDRETHRLVGAGIVGTGAGDLIAEVALAIEMGADAHDVGLTIHPHPTLSETVGLAAEVFTGTITDLLPAKRPRTAAQGEKVPAPV